jgi:hypothetical protein
MVMGLNRKAKLKPRAGQYLKHFDCAYYKNFGFTFYGWGILPHHKKIFLKKVGDCFCDIPSSIPHSPDLYSFPTYYLPYWRLPKKSFS